MQTVLVKLAERTYPIYVGTHNLSSMPGAVAEKLPSWSHAVLVCDEKLAGTFGRTVERDLLDLGKRTSMLIVPSGEESKSISILSMLWQGLLDAKSDRKSVVIALGGGVVGDLAGFAAATYTRGLRFVQIPTTLLAMVDSSVGGKTGINLPSAKNMIGAFWQPHAVWIDTTTLDSLPDREYRSGIAEIVKYGVILDADFFGYLEENADAILARKPDRIQYVVKRSCELKAQVVSEDERELTGLRAILNYGHTFGHAIEAKTAYGKFLHGEAISIGMTMAGRLAVNLGFWSQDCQHRQTTLLEKFGLPTHFEDLPADQLIEAMQADKKTEHGKLNFILPRRFGHVQIATDCDRSMVVDAIHSREC